MCVWLYRVVLDGGTSKSGVFKFNSKQTQGYLSRTNALWVKMMAPNKVKLSYNTYSKSLIYSGQKKKILSKMKLSFLFFLLVTVKRMIHLNVNAYICSFGSNFFSFMVCVFPQMYMRVSYNPWT